VHLSLEQNQESKTYNNQSQNKPAFPNYPTVTSLAQHCRGTMKAGQTAAPKQTEWLKMRFDLGVA